MCFSVRFIGVLVFFLTGCRSSHLTPLSADVQQKSANATRTHITLANDTQYTYKKSFYEYDTLGRILSVRDTVIINNRINNHSRDTILYIESRKDTISVINKDSPNKKDTVSKSQNTMVNVIIVFIFIFALISVGFDIYNVIKKK